MNKRFIATVTTIGIFVIAAPALAATTRDITSRLGGKIGDLFKLNGSFWVTKNVKIDGKLTVSKRNVVGTKRYTGTIDTSRAGDFVSTLNYPIDCTIPGYASSYSTAATHYKALSIPEIKLTSLPNIRVYYKLKTSSTMPSGYTYTPSQYPNGDNVWSSASYYLDSGKIYVYYKSVQTLCNGTATTAIPTTGEYQLLIE